MAISGMVLMLFVLGHMVGNLKLYLGASSLDSYSSWLRNVGEPALPRQTLLWAVRIVLVAAVAVHIHAAWALTLVNRRARPEAYRSPRDYVAASFASRTMRWTGIIVALFVVFHLLDLTWGAANPDFRAGDPYRNVEVADEAIRLALELDALERVQPRIDSWLRGAVRAVSDDDPGPGPFGEGPA